MENIKMSNLIIDFRDLGDESLFPGDEIKWVEIGKEDIKLYKKLKNVFYWEFKEDDSKILYD